MTSSVLIRNGACLSMDGARFDWLFLKDGRIAALGQGDRWRDLPAPPAVVIDAQGGSVLPGFIDNHFHLVQTALDNLCVDLSNARSFDDIGALIRAEGEKNPELPIHGLRLDVQNLSEGRLPGRAELDRFWSDSPVWLNTCDYQTSVLNTYAMLFYKIPFTQQGVQCDEKCMPTGLFDAKANAMLRGNILKKTSDFYRLEALKKLMPLLAGQGLTTVAAVEGGEMYCDRDAEFIEHVIAQKSVYPDIQLFFQTLDLDRVEAMGLKRVGGCLYVDGTFHTRAAAISFDYADAPGKRGILKFTQEQMDELVEQCYRRGLQLALYTIGDRAIELALQAHRRAVELTGNRSLRHRLEHVELPSPEHIRQAKDLGILFSMQPGYEFQWGGQGKMYEQRLGEHCRESNPFRRILDGGVVICGGTDSDVCRADYLWSIHAAVNHPTPAHRVSIMEAIAMFTSGGAYALGLENDRGYLKEGYRGDVVILDRDILHADPQHIRDIRVTHTLKDGALIYDREGGGFLC